MFEVQSDRVPRVVGPLRLWIDSVHRSLPADDDDVAALLEETDVIEGVCARLLDGGTFSPPPARVVEVAGVLRDAAVDAIEDRQWADAAAVADTLDRLAAEYPDGLL